jgi:hypothetical protein
VRRNKSIPSRRQRWPEPARRKWRHGGAGILAGARVLATGRRGEGKPGEEETAELRRLTAAPETAGDDRSDDRRRPHRGCVLFACVRRGEDSDRESAREVRVRASTWAGSNPSRLIDTCMLLAQLTLIIITNPLVCTYIPGNQIGRYAAYASIIN